MTNENARSLPTFRGMMPIMPTAITPSGALDEASQRRLVQYCLKCGAAAIGHFGFASEFHKISNADRTQLIKIIVDEIKGRVPFFVGVTAISTKMAVEFAKEAEDLGGDLVMAAPPYVFMPDAEGVLFYYESLSKASNLPIIVQDTPQSSALLSVELLDKMSREIEHINYVKAEGRDFITKTRMIMERCGDRLPVIGGAGGKHLIHMLRIGVKAFMTGTEALDLHGAAVKAFLEGDEEKAAKIYFEQILPYFTFYNDYAEELLKDMLHARGIMDYPDVLHPAAAAPMSDSERREFEWVLDRIGWRKRWPDIP